ncbi:MAG: hypothetical protein ACPGSD_10290 [Flavobacteriales bacterium]
MSKFYFIYIVFLWSWCVQAQENEGNSPRVNYVFSFQTDVLATDEALNWLSPRFSIEYKGNEIGVMGHLMSNLHYPNDIQNKISTPFSEFGKGISHFVSLFGRKTFRERWFIEASYGKQGSFGLDKGLVSNHTTQSNVSQGINTGFERYRTQVSIGYVFYKRNGFHLCGGVEYQVNKKRYWIYDVTISDPNNLTHYPSNTYNYSRVDKTYIDGSLFLEARWHLLQGFNK